MITFEIKSEREIIFEYYPYASHRRGRKAYRAWHPNGKKQSEEYRINGKRHRLNGPSYTSWYENGQKWYEIYCINGECQRSNYWNEQGKLRYNDNL